MKTKLILILTLLFALPSYSYALEQATGKVTLVESTYLPSAVMFSINTATTSCVAGKFLTWKKTDTSNNRATYAGLLAALQTGKSVRIFINDGDTSCVVQYIHFLAD